MRNPIFVDSDSRIEIRIANYHLAEVLVDMSPQRSRDDRFHNVDSSSHLQSKNQHWNEWFLLATKLEDLVRDSRPAILVLLQRIDPSPLVPPRHTHSQEIVDVARIERHLDIVLVLHELRRGAVQ